jgi:hypothetical protein
MQSARARAALEEPSPLLCYPFPHLRAAALAPELVAAVSNLAEKKAASPPLHFAVASLRHHFASSPIFVVVTP